MFRRSFKYLILPGLFFMLFTNLVLSEQTPFSFFNDIPARVRTTDEIDLSFRTNNTFVSQYRYKIEVPDPQKSSVNKSFLDWSAWISSSAAYIVIINMPQEGRYKLVIEYRTFSSTDIRKFEKSFYVYNPVTSSPDNSKANLKTSKVISENTTKPSGPEKNSQPDFNKLIYQAIDNKDEDLLIKSLKAGAGTGIKRSGGGNIYHMLDDSLSSEELISILKDNGYQINETDYYGNTPLHMAIMSRERKLAESLINQGADLNLKNRLELSPLHIAAFLNDDQIVKELLYHGGDINLRGNAGYTPLHVATLMNNIEVVKELIRSGADTKVKTFQNFSTKEIARVQKNELLRKLLSKNLSREMNQFDMIKSDTFNQLLNLKLNPQFELDLSYDNELLNKRKLCKAVTIISIPVLAITSAATVYLKSEADRYFLLYKNANNFEGARHYYNKTYQFDTYTYISGTLSIVSVYSFVQSLISKKITTNKMRKTFF